MSYKNVSDKFDKFIKIQGGIVSKKLNPKELYRLPWSLTDNGISWLEVTTKCNLHCKGCYRDQTKDGHKTLEEIQEDLDVFKAKRNSDCMSIAGGDPLVHPQIVEIVKMIKDMGWKPILNTNGIALTHELLEQLKEAGVFGFTFHVDLSQGRPDASASAKTEGDLNFIREKYARMLANVGGNIACSFNQTVTEKTLNQLPEVYEWALRNVDIVHSIVYILYREPGMCPQFDNFVNGKKIVMPYENTDWGDGKILKAQDAVDMIRTIEPTYEPSAYLNGTCDPDSMKWLLGVRIGQGDKTYGFVSPKFQKIVQHVFHIVKGKWLSYASPSVSVAGKITMILFSLVDKEMRKTLVNFLKSNITTPWNLFRKVSFQGFMVIQPVDFLEDGRQNMCDGCPDMTVHNGKLYWSCRLEEIKEYGTFLTTYPRQSEKTDSDVVQTSEEETQRAQ